MRQPIQFKVLQVECLDHHDNYDCYNCLETAQLLGGKSCSRRTLDALKNNQMKPTAKQTSDSM